MSGLIMILCGVVLLMGFCNWALIKASQDMDKMIKENTELKAKLKEELDAIKEQGRV